MCPSRLAVHTLTWTGVVHNHHQTMNQNLELFNAAPWRVVNKTLNSIRGLAVIHAFHSPPTDHHCKLESLGDSLFGYGPSFALVTELTDPTSVASIKYFNQ